MAKWKWIGLLEELGKFLWGGAGDVHLLGIAHGLRIGAVPPPRSPVLRQILEQALAQDVIDFIRVQPHRFQGEGAASHLILEIFQGAGDLRTPLSYVALRSKITTQTLASSSLPTATSRLDTAVVVTTGRDPCGPMAWRGRSRNRAGSSSSRMRERIAFQELIHAVCPGGKRRKIREKERRGRE